MSNSGVTGLPVLDENGYLLANISASDLRTIHRSTAGRVLHPILDFIAHSHEGEIPAPIYVTRDVSLLHAITVFF
jgi:CBS domain-containing protein